jgi:hypothetical protein
MFTTTIIKCNPGQRRGVLRGFTITQVYPDHRDVYAVIAKTGIEAINNVRNLQAMRARHQMAAA